VEHLDAASVLVPIVGSFGFFVGVLTIATDGLGRRVTSPRLKGLVGDGGAVVTRGARLYSLVFLAGFGMLSATLVLLLLADGLSRGLPSRTLGGLVGVAGCGASLVVVARGTSARD
jgi:hypothetical protein